MKFVAPLRVAVPATIPTTCRGFTIPDPKSTSSATWTRVSVPSKRLTRMGFVPHSSIIRCTTGSNGDIA